MATPHRLPEPSPAAARSVRESLPDELKPMVHRASEMVRNRSTELDEAPLKTSVSELDRLLGGGLPRGSMVELVGRGSCGRFATLLATVRMVTDTGQPAALVDQGRQLDPRLALEIGIDLERLLWVHPNALPDSLAAAEMLVHTGFPLIALDLGLPPVRGRAPLAAWLRLARGVAARRAAVLVGSPYHLSGCAATAVLTAGGGRGRWSGAMGDPRLLHGVDSWLEVARLRGQRPHERARVAFSLPEATFEPVIDTETRTVEVPHAQTR